MLTWVTNIFDYKTKADLHRQIADQQETIRGLMSREVAQLAKLAYEWANYSGDTTKGKFAARVIYFGQSHRDALRCLTEGPEDG